MKRTDLNPSLDDAVRAMISRGAQSAVAANPAGSISVPNADGTRTVLGVAAGTSGVAPWVGDTTAPGRPTGLSATSHNGVVLMRWDGTLDGGLPPDFHHVEFTATYGGTTLDLGSLTAAGELASGVIAGGTVVTLTAVAYDDAHAENGAPSPNASPVSDPVTVTVQSSVDPAVMAELGDKLAAAQQTLDQAQDDIDQAQKSASDAATQAATAVASASAAATQAAQASVDASSAVVLRVDSSEGTTFKNSSGSTVFTVAVMAKGKVITDIVDLQSTLGAGAYLEWSWKTRGGGDFGILSSADPRITNGGFALHVSSADVDTTAVFQCSLQVP